MHRFLENPQLPEGEVSLIIAGERYRERLAPALERLDIELLPMPDSKLVPVQLGGHVDLLITHLGGGRFVIAEGADETGNIVNSLTNRGAQLQFCRNPGRSYPEDARLNCCIFGGYLLCNSRITDRAILESGFSLIDVRQGYAGCSVCVVDERSVITADRGISRSLREYDIDVLEITAGGVELPGYDTGFIGGASFKLSADKLAFTGNLDSHPDRQRILGFLKNRSIEPVFLTDEPIFDIGSAVTVLERS